MRKRATYQYSDVLRDRPHEKMRAGTITAARSKGQMNNPMKYADIPAETKKSLRKMNVRDLTRSMERAGGPTSPKGRMFAAVLEERGVNPNLSGTNPVLARQASNDIYKRAMYDAFSDELTKLSQQQAMTQPVAPQKNRARDLGMTSAGGMAVPAAAGTLLGGATGAAMGSGLGRVATGAAGAVLGGGIGAAFGYNTMRSGKLNPEYQQAIDYNRKHG